jgi:hypothetical protein
MLRPCTGQGWPGQLAHIARIHKHLQPPACSWPQSPARDARAACALAARGRRSRAPACGRAIRSATGNTLRQQARARARSITPSRKWGMGPAAFQAHPRGTSVSSMFLGNPRGGTAFLTRRSRLVIDHRSHCLTRSHPRTLVRHVHG